MEKSLVKLEERYIKNSLALSVEEVNLLHNKKVCVIGCGGLGGHVVELLARIGIGTITVVDDDVFEISNLNRQLFSTEKVLGVPKVEVAKQRIREVNSQIYFKGMHIQLDENNGEEIIKGHDIVVDALDNMKTRLILERVCNRLSIPFVHGSIGGWYGQVASIFPGDDTLHKIYQNVKGEKGEETVFGNLSFIVSLVASIQCAECVKILIRRGKILQKEMLQIDLLSGEFYTMQL